MNSLFVKCGSSMLRRMTKRPKLFPLTVRRCSMQKDELLAKVTIVDNEDQCAVICKKIIALGQPIAMDCEGIQLPVLGLLQVKSADNKIYLFRTGINRKLFSDGGLKELLENPDLTKVMHASSIDCSAIYRENVKMRPLYDTCTAHRIIQYQKLGRSLGSRTVGYNELCEIYGVKGNPMKEKIKSVMWQKESMFLSNRPLSEEVVYYSAADVESLLDLYHITSNMIETDFMQLFQDICECELIRPIDPELVRMKQKMRVKVEDSNIFVYNLKDDVAKVDIHNLLSKYDGYKKVLFSEKFKTVHILMPSREKAAMVHQMIRQVNPTDILGENFHSVLVKDLLPSEVVGAEQHIKKYENKLLEDNFIVDLQLGQQIVSLLIQAKVPIVVEFSILPNGSFIEVFAGCYPSFKFSLSTETITLGGIGDLMASTDVIKIVGRIDTNNAYSALKQVSALGYKPQNFFDVNTSYKVVDYLQFGQSMFKSPSLSLNDATQHLGIHGSQLVENQLYAFLHLNRILPEEMLHFLKMKAQAEVEIAGNVDTALAKNVRKQLRKSYETFCVHIQCLEGPADKLEEFIKDTMRKHSIKHKVILCDGNIALLDLNSDVNPEFRKGISVLSSNSKANGFDLKLDKIDFWEIANNGRSHTVPEVNLKELDMLNAGKMDTLQTLGLFKILADNAKHNSSSGNNTKPSAPVETSNINLHEYLESSR
jgi:hypothetical protein